MSWWVVYLGVAAAATVATAVTTPLFRALAWRVDFLDKPLHQAHKRHEKATPVLGGAAMITGWLLVIGGGIVVKAWAPGWLPGGLRSLASGVSVRDAIELLAVVAAGGVFLGGMGLVDDRRPMGPGLKLALQLVLCSLLACYPKLQVTLFWQNPLISWLLTVGWFVFIINSLNFLDNMDGLAAGLALIASALFATVAGIREQYLVASLGAVTAGTCLGFYLYNRAPASIFMGDSGSHFLGFMLAVQGSLTTFYVEATPTVAPVLIPALILALPIFDTFAVIVIRLRLGKPVYRGDHNHISHRFKRLGTSAGTAVLLVHLLALAIGLGALTLLEAGGVYVVIVLVQVAAMLALVSILHSLHPADGAPPAPGEAAPEPAAEEERPDVRH